MGTIAKKTERTMPSTGIAILRPRSTLLQAVIAVFVSSVALAAPKFTLVIGGKITSEDALEDKGGRRVSVKAVADLARAAGGMSVAFDAEAGVVSITHDGGAVAEKLSGFKGAAITFVIDGKITRVPAKVGAEGVPYLAAKDLKKIAEALGYVADLDAAGSVLALTPKSAAATVTAASTEPVATPEQSWGLNGTFMKSVAAGSSGATKTSGGGDVCSYLDGQKVVWLATEPSDAEKSAFKNLAAIFTANEKLAKAGKGKDIKVNKGDLQLLEKTLKSFSSKVDQRTAGTKNSNPPEGAKEWYSISIDFLDKVQAAMKLSMEIVNEYKLPDAKQPKKEVFEKQHKRLQELNTEIQAAGTQEVEIVTTVREGHDCGPP